MESQELRQHLLQANRQLEIMNKLLYRIVQSIEEPEETQEEEQEETQELEAEIIDKKRITTKDEE